MEADQHRQGITVAVVGYNGAPVGNKLVTRDGLSMQAMRGAWHPRHSGLIASVCQNACEAPPPPCHS